jgi:UDP-glucose 4-epimerase
MKVVVTGSSGQLGSLVLERLVNDRKIKRIVALDLVAPRVPSPKIEYRIADVRDPGFERHVEGADALVHLAFVVSGARSREAMYGINVDGTRRVLHAALQHAVRRVVYASSIAAYGIVEGHPRPIVEDSPRKRTGYLDYADHKYENEEMLDRFERDHPEIAVVRLRPGVLLGRRISHVPESLVRRRIMPVVGQNPAPVVWDEDVADAVLLALHGEVRGAFNLAADDPVAPEEMARLGGFRALHLSHRAAERILHTASYLARHPADRGWVQAGDVPLSVSAAKAKRVLGWKPRYPTAADVATAFGKQALGRTDPRLRVFLVTVSRMSKRSREHDETPREGRTVKMLIHLDVTGPDGGDFAVNLDTGILRISPGIPRPPDAVIAVSTETFLGMLSGEVNASTAAMTGKVRVRGEPLAGMVLAGIVGGFRRATELGGAQGAIARRLSKWFEQGEGR